MARIVGAVCRLCRREGMKLYLKGSKCESSKCPVSRRDYPPGIHNMSRKRPTEYGLRLRETQKAKRAYGVSAKSFRWLLKRESAGKGNTGVRLLIALESRIDNVLYRGGFAVSRSQARQWIVHQHVRVDGRRVKTPSARVRAGQVVAFFPRPHIQKLVRAALEETKGRKAPTWMQVNEEALEIRLVTEPTREEVTLPLNERLIVEFASR